MKTIKLENGLFATTNGKGKTEGAFKTKEEADKKGLELTKTQIGFVMSVELQKKLRQIATLEDRGVGYVITKAIEAYLKN